MAFVKLDCGILNSTLWVERESREVFITALLMAEPIEITESVEQLAVANIEPTGYIVPPGWYGFVEAAGPGIVRRALVDHAAGMAALQRLGEPDPESRSSDFEGRRLVRVDGGFIVLNFMKYRDKDSTTAERSRRWRQRQKEKQLAEDAKRSSPVADTATRVIRHQAEAEAEAEADIRNSSDQSTTLPVAQSGPDDFSAPQFLPGKMAALCRGEGIGVTAINPCIHAWVTAGKTLNDVEDAISRARQQKPFPEAIPINYLNKIVLPAPQAQRSDSIHERRKATIAGLTGPTTAQERVIDGESQRVD